MPTPIQILKEYWGYNAFRPAQLPVIESVLAGNDTLAILPTGGGKSVCYQVPALIKGGLCLVISPLIALIKDQVAGLQKKGITALAVYSGMSHKEVQNIYTTALESNCRFLFVSPERLKSQSFLAVLPALPIKLIAVDEAHCISQWGYDFRPSYLQINGIRDEFPGVPVLALTASATPVVQKDICHKLTVGSQLDEPVNLNYPPQGWNIFRNSFERPNLSYSVFFNPAKINKTVDILKAVKGSAIIYCRTRKRTQEISHLLELQGIETDFYHAGLNAAQRSKKQDNWIKNTTRVMVCTNAFGMGIDKPDVRVVIHLDAPENMESYYQEAGRAGRDEKKAYAVLLYDNHDIAFLSNLPAEKFPSVEELQKIYHAIANYLHIPVNQAGGEYFDFDFSVFAHNFKLKPVPALHALKALEQEGWLAFSEQVFLPVKIMIQANRQQLADFENEFPELNRIILLLLRLYGGILDVPVPVSEQYMAQKLQLTLAELQKKLHRLHQTGMIYYEAQKELPQLVLLKSRVKASLLTIDEKKYHQRKKVYAEKIAAILKYTHNNTECRSSYIARYFGDTPQSDCGVCDNCLNKKKDSFFKKDFDTVITTLHKIAIENFVSRQTIAAACPAIKKQQLSEILFFLQQEDRLVYNEQGALKLKQAFLPTGGTS